MKPATDAPTVQAPAARLLGGRYQLRTKVGAGGFGDVYEALDTRLGKTVAVKLPAGPYAQHPEALARFGREAMAASQVGHDGVVEVIDFGRDLDGTHFIVMEYLAGVELRTIIDNHGPLPATRALQIATGIANALAATHAAGVVHRDLKPDNVRIIAQDGSDSVKVFDFGVSKLIDGSAPLNDLTVPGMVFGTAEYLAPEQARGLPADRGVDVYALGIILYEMVVGHPPFEGGQPFEVIRQHVTQSPLRPSLAAPHAAIASQLDQLILRLLTKDPAGRPPMPDVAVELLAVLRTLNPLAADAVAPAPAQTGSTVTPVPRAESNLARVHPLRLSRLTGTAYAAVTVKVRALGHLRSHPMLVSVALVFVVGLLSLITYLAVPSTSSSTAAAHPIPTVLGEGTSTDASTASPGYAPRAPSTKVRR